MTAGQMSNVLRQVRRMALHEETAGLTDAELLARYLRNFDDTAFEALVTRHGPMVLGVCQRILRTSHDAEDAFQATFLVLVRKASSIFPREMVGNWLYGVAYRTAMKARSATAKRHARERHAASLAPAGKYEAELWDDLGQVVDQELNSLPDRYRVPVVLCDLEGKTHQEAARQLGWPTGTLSTRLNRARRKLAERLRGHGLALSASSLGVVLSREASARVPASLVTSTSRAAKLFATHTIAAGAVSAQVGLLTEGVLKTMLVSKLKVVWAVLLVAAALSGGMATLSQVGVAGEQGVPAKAPADHEEKRVGKPAMPKRTGKLLQRTYQVGDWVQKDGDEAALMKLITNTIEPGSWAELGGPDTIDYFPLGKALVVSQTEEVHQQIAQLLAALRNAQELEKLKGTWTSVYWEEAGKKSSKEEADDYQIVFKNDGVTIEQGRSKAAGRFERHAVTMQCANVDPTQDPKSIDLALLGNKRRGIYHLDGDQLKICLGPMGGRRPARFATSEKDECTLLVLRRAIKPTSADAYLRPTAATADSRDVRDVLMGEDLAWRLLGVKTKGLCEVVDVHGKVREGVKILAVRPDSTAAKQNVKPGDVLLGLHTWQTTNHDSVPFVLGYCQGKGMSRVRFVILRDRETVTGEFSVAPSEGEQPVGEGNAKAGPAQKSGPGWLRRAPFWLDQKVTYVLESSQGMPRMYVTPSGINLEAFVGRAVELTGTIAYRGDVRTYHMTAANVKVLEKESEAPRTAFAPVKSVERAEEKE